MIAPEAADLAKRIEQEASSLNQQVENSKIQKRQKIKQLSSMIRDENNVTDQYSLMGSNNISNFFSASNQNNNGNVYNSNNFYDKSRNKSSNNLLSNNDMKTPSLTPQQSGILNTTQQNYQQQNLFQQQWSEKLYNDSNLNQKSPMQSGHHSKSPSAINTTNRYGSSSIHQTPHQQQMITPYNNNKRFFDQQSNQQFQKQLINSNSQDKLAKRIEFNNPNDSSINSALTPHSFSPMNAQRRIPLMNNQVNIQQNNFTNQVQPQPSQMAPMYQMKQSQMSQAQQNMKSQQKQYLPQQQQQPNAKMFGQTNLNYNQSPMQINVSAMKNQQKQAISYPKQMLNPSQMMQFAQQQQQQQQLQQQQIQQQILTQRQNQMMMKQQQQYQDQYHFDSTEGNQHQHFLSDGVLGTYELENDNDFQQEQDTFEDQGYNQEDEIEEQQKLYQDLLMTSQPNQLGSSSYLIRNEDIPNSKKLKHQYLLQQQQLSQQQQLQQQQMNNDILRTPQQQPQLAQYVTSTKNNHSIYSNPRQDYQSQHSFNTPKMTSKVQYSTENGFPFNQQQPTSRQILHPQQSSHSSNNLNQFYLDQGKSEEDFMPQIFNQRQQQSISARDNSRIRINPSMLDSDSASVPPRTISHAKSSSIQNPQLQPPKIRMNQKSFSNQYQLLQSPEQEEIEQNEFLQNIPNMPSPIPQNSNQQNYFPSRDHSLVYVGNNSSQQMQQQQQMNNSFIRSKNKRDRSPNQIQNSNSQFQQTFSQQSQGQQMQSQYQSVGHDQYPANKQSTQRVSLYSKQNLDSSMISARKTPKKNQVARKSPTPVRQQIVQEPQGDDEKTIELKKQLEESQSLISKMQEELRTTKDELEDYKFAFKRTVQKCKSLTQQIDNKGKQAQITFYQKALLKEKNINRNLREMNNNIKRKILKLKSTVYDQYIKDREEYIDVQNELSQFELQNQFLRDILAIGSFNDSKCEVVNQILEKEEEEIYKNQEPPNQEKLIEKQRNKILIERIDCEEDNLSEENNEIYLNRLIENQIEIENQKQRALDNSRYNPIFGQNPHINQADCMRDLEEDKNIEPAQNQQNPPILPASPSSSSFSDDKANIPTNSSLNNSFSSENSGEIKLNNSLTFSDTDENKRNGGNPFSLINSTSMLNQPSNKPLIQPIALSQQNSGNSPTTPPSLISSSSLLSVNAPKSGIASTSVLSPVAVQNTNKSVNPSKLSGGRSIFSDLSSRAGGVFGSSTISPQNRMKSPDPLSRQNSSQQKPAESNSNQSSFSLKKNLEQLPSISNQSSSEKLQEEEGKQTDLKDNKPNTQEENKDNESSQNKEQPLSEDDDNQKIEDDNNNNGEFTFDNSEDDNFNILDDNEDDEGPISEDDILVSNTNPYFISQNNNQNQKQQEQSEPQDDSTQIKQENKGFISNSSLFASNNPSTNQNTNVQGTNIQPQSNSFISNSSLFNVSSSSDSNAASNQQDKTQNQNSGFIGNSGLSLTANSNINSTNNTNSISNNSQPLIATNSSFISSSSIFGPPSGNFMPYGNVPQKKKQDDDVVKLPDYKYEPIQKNEGMDYQQQYKNEEPVQQQQQQQQPAKKETINFKIPFN